MDEYFNNKLTLQQNIQNKLLTCLYNILDTNAKKVVNEDYINFDQIKNLSRQFNMQINEKYKQDIVEIKTKKDKTDMNGITGFYRVNYEEKVNGKSIYNGIQENVNKAISFDKSDKCWQVTDNLSGKTLCYAVSDDCIVETSKWENYKIVWHTPLLHNNKIYIHKMTKDWLKDKGYQFIYDRNHKPERKEDLGSQGTNNKDHHPINRR